MCGDGVNSLDNIMTLDSPIHSWFDKLQLWFEAVVSGLQFSVLTLNVCRTARKTPTISVRRQEHSFTPASQIQSC
jgi:hypothetical protein